MLRRNRGILRGRIIISFCIFCLFGFGLASNNGVSADDSVVDLINITVPSSCSFAETVDDNNVYTATVRNNEYEDDIGHTTFKVFCNDKDGYSIYAVGYSEDTFGNTEMVYQGSANPAPSNIVTGTATSGSTSNWAMKMNAVAGPYAPTLTNGFGSYRTIPSTYTKVATFPSQTDNNTGSSVQSSYAVFVSATQPAGTYEGKVRYTLVHPASEVPAQPQTTQSGKICYYPNGSNVEGTMGCQTIPASGGTADTVTPTSATLLASNFSRAGYGFAGWNTEFDYSGTNYGPQEYISFMTGQYSGSNPGLSLYAHWVESAGTLQGWTCPSNTNMPIGAVTALTDLRDNETYAVAKLADGNCWMIENLRLEAEDTRSDANKALAQGYGTSTTYGNFSGLADSESTGFTDTYTANSLYYSGTQEGTASIDIGTSNYPGYRMPRYNNLNTPANANNRPQNPTSNTFTDNNTTVGMYSYGNYYTWHAAIADFFYHDTNDYSVATTSLCPVGWRLPKGGDKANIDPNSNNEFWNLIVAGINHGTLPANYNSQTRPYYTGSTEAGPVADSLRAYPNNFLYSGFFDSSSARYRGSFGAYWTSTVSDSLNSYHLYLFKTSVYPGTYYSFKYGGQSIRCLVSGT